MCCRNDLFLGWNQLELYSDWSLSPNSDQHEFSLNNIKTSSIEKVRRSNKLMNKGEVLWFFIKFCQLILQGNVWTLVWRICFFILELNGLMVKF